MRCKCPLLGVKRYDKANGAYLQGNIERYYDYINRGI